MRWRVDDRLAPSLPLYVGACAAATAGLAAVTMTVDAPAFTFFIHTLLILGYASSFWGRATGHDLRPLGVVVFGLAFVEFAFARLEIVVPGANVFFPYELTLEDLPAAGLVAWLTVALAFAAYHRGSLLWNIVSCLALFGLVGTINLNFALAADFFIFLFALLFTVGYENLLAQEEAVGGPAPGWGPARARARNLLASTGWTFLFVTLVALVLGTALHRAIPRPYSAAFQRHLQGLVGASAPNYAALGGEFQLGTGPIQLSHTPVFHARGDSPPLWRVHAVDHYGNNVWSRTLSGYGTRIVVPQAGRAVLPAPQGVAPSVPRQRHTVAVTPLRDLAGPLPFPSHPAAISLPPRREEPFPFLAHRVVWLDSYGCVRVRPGLRTGRTYEAEYDVLRARAPDLEAAPPVTWRDFLSLAGSEDGARDLFAAYTQVPNEIWDDLHALSYRATGGTGKAYHKLQALQAYLYQNCAYTLSAPATPQRRDAVLYFLKNSGRGACDLFASSLVLLARAEGLPARVATGFAEGTWDGEARCFVITESELHAWAEVYFSGFGWVAFDPPARLAPPEASVLDLLRTGRWAAAVGRVVRRWSLWVLLVIGLVWTLSTVLDASSLLRWIRRERPADHSLRAQIALLYQRTCDALARRDLGREPWQTAAEHLGAVREADGPLVLAVLGPLEELANVFRRARYGPGPVTEGDLARAREAADRVFALVRRPPRSRTGSLRPGIPAQ